MKLKEVVVDELEKEKIKELNNWLIKELNKRNIGFFDLKDFVYKTFFKLFFRYGKQYWWPSSFKGEKRILEILIGAVLTQNTSWKQVEKSLNNLKRENLISLKLIEEIRENKEFIVKLIKPSGFASIKINTLFNLLNYYKENKNRVNKKSTSVLRKELLNIKGIGEETADSILLYAFERPVFVVDNYTKKLILKFLGKEIKNYNLLRLSFELTFNFLNTKKKVKLFNEYHALIVEFGKNKFSCLNNKSVDTALKDCPT